MSSIMRSSAILGSRVAWVPTEDVVAILFVFVE